MSPPSRGRGLKHPLHLHATSHSHVAPFAGAWIETNTTINPGEPEQVAPFAGAWIETKQALIIWAGLWSPPSRGRGLKHNLQSLPPVNLGRPLRGGVD